ncbi:MAG: response regulator [Candidatus Eisenbacteria bacterium]|jgi:DNA-binding response OmpR family regulator|nr:response regulator [Candidatus Eisenbacteria bacterium]
MSPTIICPHCGVSNIVAEGQVGAAEGNVCESCRGYLRDRPDPARPTTVLCIDDDPLVLHFYRDFLDRRGYRTLTVTDGLAGLALAKRELPDVILLDVMLRGLSGFDICRKLRAEPALHTTPIILLTVWDHSSVANTGRAAGATLTLRKPADPEVILTNIEQVLGHQNGSPLL